MWVQWLEPQQPRGGSHELRWQGREGKGAWAPWLHRIPRSDPSLGFMLWDCLPRIEAPCAVHMPYTDVLLDALRPTSHPAGLCSYSHS